VFQAQLRSSVTCHACERQSNTFQPFSCVHLPIPQKELVPVFVTVLYIDQTPRQVRLGLTVGAQDTVADLRRQLSRDTGIEEGQILLTEIGKLGFRRTLRDYQPVSAIKETEEELYCIELPKHKLASEDDGAYVVLTWVNIFKEGPIEKRFGTPYAIQVSRETLYGDLQKLLLKEMASILHDDILVGRQKVPLFKIHVLDGFECGQEGGVNSSLLKSTVDLPLYSEQVEQAVNLCSVEGGGVPAHVKLTLEWDMAAKTQVIVDDSDVVEEHASVKEVEKSPQEAASVSLQDCFDLYTKAEKLGVQDAWLCTNCNRKREAVKRMFLWSVPEVLVIHLMRFRQSSPSSTNKLTTMVDFPMESLDMTPSVVKSEKNVTEPKKTENEGPPSSGGESAPIRMLNALSLWRSRRSSSRSAATSGASLSAGRNEEEYLYDLYAVCNHHGSDLQGGHYTANCRNPTDGQWYSFDDVHTKPLRESEVLTQDAYILFYQRQTQHSSSSTSSSSSSASSGQEHWVYRMPDYTYKKTKGLVKVSSSAANSPKKSVKNGNNKHNNNNNLGLRSELAPSKGEPEKPKDASSATAFQRNSSKYATLPVKRLSEVIDCEPERHSDIEPGSESDEDEENETDSEVGESSSKTPPMKSAEATISAQRFLRKPEDEDEEGISRPISGNDVD